jgi:hypothetical protein
MSYSGTVRCSYCGVKGHNRTGCPELKKKWEEDPNSYQGREWAAIQARKNKPKTCSYCKTEGHTRAGCKSMEQHKAQFQDDLILWRKAVLKWAKDIGLGIGAMVSSKKITYRKNNRWVYPSEEGYVPPVGMVMNKMPNAFMSHYSGIGTASEWLSFNNDIGFYQAIGSESERGHYCNVGVGLPCIPGIVPRFLARKNCFGDITKYDRSDYAGETINWEIVSPAVKDFDSAWASTATVKDVTKDHFKGANGDGVQEHQFVTFDDSRRDQLQKYVNGEIELSEMFDSELPVEDS